MKTKVIKNFIKRLFISQKELNILSESLIKATKYNSLDNVKSLVNAGARLNINKQNSLKNAISNGNVEMVDFLIENGEVLKKDIDYFIYAFNSKSIEMIEFLVSKGLSFEKNSSIFLKNAAEHNHFNVVEYLIKKGVCPNGVNGRPLRNACYNNRFEIVKLLVENGADIDVMYGNPLRSAVNGKNWKIVKYLVENGAQIDINNNYLLTKLSESNTLALIKYLIVEKSQNVDIVIENPKVHPVVLDWAVSYKKSKVLHDSLKNNLKINENDSNNRVRKI